MFKNFVPILFAIILVSLLACQSVSDDTLKPVIETNGAEPETTTLVIKRLSDNKVWISNVQRASNRYIPASTSKIPHTLIALETKQAEPETLFKWDGRERWVTSWNQNQTLTQAYKRSAAWVYQVITRRLGPDMMTLWLSRFEYGNYDIGSTNNVTKYWLEGPLEISALEQVDFLTKLSLQELPLSLSTYQKSRTIFKEQSNGYHTLYAKTGWVHDGKTTDIGWFVGWVETQDISETYVFALNMDMPNKGDQNKRRPIVMDGLKSIGAWPR